MAKKSKPASELVDGIVMKRIAELQHDLDAAKRRIDDLEAAHIHYAPAQHGKTVWWRLWS